MSRGGVVEEVEEGEVEGVEERWGRVGVVRDPWGMEDGEVPWWAVGLVELRRGSDESRARWGMVAGRRPRTDRGWEGWRGVVEKARRLAERRPLREWLDRAWEEERTVGGRGPVVAACRHVALTSPRVFVSFAGLADDEGRPVVLKDFHVRVVDDLRRHTPVVELLPFEHGKSYLSGMVVPLMDWAEEPSATECRVYLSGVHVGKWPRRLMGQVEHNENLHRLFPWIRKPVKGDRCQRWGVEGFGIGGRPVEDAGFVPMTIKQYAVGVRYWRTVVDDVVNSRNSVSAVEMDYMWEHFHAGPMTYGQTVRRWSRYRTRWGTVALVGTVFAEGDLNYRVYEQFVRMGYRARRYDVFPHGDESRERGEVLWPEARPFDYVMRKKEELGESAFLKRMRNIVDVRGVTAFPRRVVERALGDGQEGREVHGWGVVPAGTRVMVGFDPGSGRTSKFSKNPAIFLYGEQRVGDVTLYRGICWQRLEGMPFTRQCDVLAEWARRWGCPVVVEDNGVQAAYGDYVRTRYPDVSLVTYTNKENRRDPTDGVEQFVPLFEQGLVKLHCWGAPRNEVDNLVKELTGWPTWKYTDLVMAMWIARRQMQLRREMEEAPQVTARLPWYAGLGSRRIYRIPKGVG